MNETHADRLKRFSDAMAKAGARVDSDSDAAAPVAEVAPVQEPAPQGTPAPAEPAPTEPQGAGDPAAAAPAEQAPWWKVKVKALDEEREIDLAKLAKDNPEEYRALLGKGLSHDTIKERLYAARDAAREELVTAKQRATQERDQQFWIPLLQGSNLKLEQDPQGKFRIAGSAQTNAVLRDAPGQADRTALKKRALEENTTEAWMALFEAQEAALSKAIDREGAEQLVETKFTQGQRALAERTQLQQEAATFSRKFDSLFESHKATFAKFGDPAVIREELRVLGHRRASAPEATEAQVLSVITERAKSYESALKTIQGELVSGASKPRPKAPTVIPAGGGAPATASTDPGKIPGDTPEGRAKRVAYLESLKRQAARPASVS